MNLYSTLNVVPHQIRLFLADKDIDIYYILYNVNTKINIVMTV